MKITALDTETFLIGPGVAAPPLVCVSYCSGTDAGLLNHVDGVEYVRSLLSGSDSYIVGHNIVYDLGVLAGEDSTLLALIFRAYEDNRIRDTGIRQKLHDLADGSMKWERKFDAAGDETFIKRRYSLAELVYRYSDKVLAKDGHWRMRYGTLRGTPIEWWPEEARRYSLNDAKETFGVYIAQNNFFTQYAPGMIKDGTVVNECDQARAAWALHLMRIWGLRTDRALVQDLKKRLESKKYGLGAELMQNELVRPKGTKNLSMIRKKITEAYGDRIDSVPRTEKKQELSTSGVVLRGSGDPLLRKLCDYEDCEKTLSTFVPTIERGVYFPITPEYNELVESGRVSARAPNVQQLPRDGEIRGCFVPRKGFVFVSCDYSSLEMCSLAQVCLDLLGESAIAEAMRADKDPHLIVVAQLESKSYEEVLALYKTGDKKIKELRQLSKCLNYGLPGGMGAETFVEYASKQEIYITVAQSVEAKAYWLRTWPEIKKYFNWIAKTIGPPGEGEIRQLRSNRVRYVHTYTSACNTFFQGLAADGAKEACFRAAKESYLDVGTPLYGCRPVAFLHDEIMLEAPEWKASEAAKRLATVMIEAMQMYIPDVPIKAEPVLMRRWFKDAKPVFANGKLVTWEPEESRLLEKTA